MKATSIRRGTVILYNNAPHRVMEFHHNTPGKGQACVQTKLRNLLTGSQTEVRFNSTEDIAEADVHTTTATFLYKDMSGYHFMLTETYEQHTLSENEMGDAVYYLKDEMEVGITLYNDNPIGVTLPQTVVLTIVDTEPELKGATATSSPKPAMTDTGLSVSVPPFVKIGDKIVVGTEEGNYIKRAE
jgi:elongation factor P